MFVVFSNLNIITHIPPFLLDNCEWLCSDFANLS